MYPQTRTILHEYISTKKYTLTHNLTHKHTLAMHTQTHFYLYQPAYTLVCTCMCIWMCVYVYMCGTHVLHCNQILKPMYITSKLFPVFNALTSLSTLKKNIVQIFSICFQVFIYSYNQLPCLTCLAYLVNLILCRMLCIIHCYHITPFCKMAAIKFLLEIYSIVECWYHIKRNIPEEKFPKSPAAWNLYSKVDY